MDTALFDYDLPENLIAATPANRRDESRLLVVERKTKTVAHRIFRDLPDILPAGTALFRNNARVLRARLSGMRPTGGKVECLLLRPAEKPDAWWCLLKPGKRAADAAGFGLPGIFHATVIAQENGEYKCRFSLPENETVLSVAEKIGAIPLPPYIEKKRPKDGDFSALDNERYQTVYADPGRTVAAAAPTAGLHFTNEILQKLSAKPVPFFDLTLHIGLGTFQPIKSEKIEEHKIHHEFYEIPHDTREALKTRRPRLAVGTTSLRAMEDFSRKNSAGAIDENGNGTCFGDADLFIFPPSKFLGAEFLLTNFHLPRSTLMLLVSAFLAPENDTGIAFLREIYAEAISLDYRFYSYGDAMLIL